MCTAKRLKIEFVNIVEITLETKSDGDSDEIFEDEARHIRKVVLCVLLEEWRAVLGKVAKDSHLNQILEYSSESCEL